VDLLREFIEEKKVKITNKLNHMRHSFDNGCFSTQNGLRNLKPLFNPASKFSIFCFCCKALRFSTAAPNGIL